MESSENIISKKVNKKPIKPNDVVVAPVNKDGNCFYRALSLFLPTVKVIIKSLGFLFIMRQL